jgi:aldehyde:ferredoxin oxidoreductase
MGAVMGSKNLKAIAVRSSSRKIPLYDPEGFAGAASAARKMVRENRFTEGEATYGTPLIASIINQIGRFPTNNFQRGDCDYIDEISGETLHEKFFDKNMACYACPIGCDKVFSVKEGEFSGTVTTSLEYEALSSLGSRCGNSNLSSIIKANQLCDDYGMDVISAGGVIGFAMELWEKGIISAADTGGIDLAWGNYHSILKLLEDIALKRGFGSTLAEGVRKAAEIMDNLRGKSGISWSGTEEIRKWRDQRKP